MYAIFDRAVELKKVRVSDGNSSSEEVYTKYFLNPQSAFDFLSKNESFNQSEIDYLNMEGEIEIEQGWSFYNYSIRVITIEGNILK